MKVPVNKWPSPYFLHQLVAVAVTKYVLIFCLLEKQI